MKKHFLSLIFFMSTLALVAQVDEHSALSKRILEQDSLLFEVGFNTCDLSQFEHLLSEELRFYHDKDGISDKAKFLADLKNGLCKDPEKRQVTRILVKESTRIFPLYKNGELYAAIHNGQHLFAENGAKAGGIASFSNLWKLEEGIWRLHSSLSYDHQPILH